MLSFLTLALHGSQLSTSSFDWCLDLPQAVLPCPLGICCGLTTQTFPQLPVYILDSQLQALLTSFSANVYHLPRPHLVYLNHVRGPFHPLPSLLPSAGTPPPSMAHYPHLSHSPQHFPPHPIVLGLHITFL